MKRLAHLDQQLFQWIAKQTTNQYQTSVMRLFKTVSKTGDGHLYFVLAAILYYLDTEHGTVFFYTALLAYSLEVPIYLILKHCFKRRRPCDLFTNFSSVIVPSDKFSLPSGHTAAAFLMATVIAHFYPALGLVAYVWASLVGLSRIVLRVHFPLDVLIGMALGVTFALTSISILG
ncbi:phosphatase PAP2 family protein [Glaciecola sp. 1036]|uniref:phosphatase PAP2 family protein n=1 Tax=Alteromonadaceae TaxID=72275 RepID=UPI003D08711C